VQYGGYGFDYFQLACFTFTSVVAIVLGEVFGHFFNDFLADRYIKKHNGIFEPEGRLPAIYLANILMLIGLTALGQCLEHHYGLGGIIMSLGTFIFGLMVVSVAVFNYSVDAYPMAAAEVAGWISLVRVISGFSVGYYQTPWAEAVGFGASLGTQAGILGFCTIFVVVVHVYGHRLRVRAGPVR
jgi:hypothetical protein